MFDNIPAEIRAIPHWVAAGPDKVPINPRTGKFADPAKPKTGGTFAEAVHCGMKHIGFILSDLDPFTIIDLDDPWQDKQKAKIDELHPEFSEAMKRADRHDKIFNMFPTYTELSQSGTGVHLVMKGAIPCGVRRDKVEVYSKERYMIFTGKVLKNQPVENCQPLLDQIFLEMGRMVTPDGELIEEEETLSDNQIWSIATNASNAEKFVALCDGDWQAMNYPSQSEADFALTSMLAFYSRSNEQVIRLFRQTGLGQREKAGRDDYFRGRYGMLRKIRAKEAPLVDLSQLLPVPAAIPTQAVMQFADLPETPKATGYTFPPGMVGEVAKYILSSAIRPVPEIALGAAIAFCAGVCARSYNISGTGLNQYVIILAKTGRGKEGAASGIDNLVASVRPTCPSIDQFIGPAAYASGQALVKVLDQQKCFVSVLGEFGLTLQQICEPNAAAPLTMLKKVLLDIYAKSGHSKVLRPSVYSEREKNTQIIQAPNVTLLGESTPETFFGGLENTHIDEGLIPRFLVIEYKGKRPPPNPNAFHLPDEALTDALGRLVSNCVNMGSNSQCCPVSISEEAGRVFDRVNLEADEHINADGSGTESELYNRYHLKVMKLAALIAVGVNPMAPNVTGEIAEWAEDTIARETRGMLERFSAGDVGSGEAKLESEIRRLFNHFQTLSPKQRASHRCPDGLIDLQVCPLQYLSIYCRRISCFKNDKRGATRALNETLADMVAREVFERVNLHQLTTQFKMKSPIFYPGPGW